MRYLASLVPAHVKGDLLSEPLGRVGVDEHAGTDSHIDLDDPALADSLPRLLVPQPHTADSRLHLASDGVSVIHASPRWESRYVRWLALCDLFAAAMAAVIGVLVRFDPATGIPTKTLSFVALPALFCLLVAGCGGYDSRFLAAGTDEYRRVFDAGVRCIALFAIASFALRLGLPRSSVVVACPLATVGAISLRFSARRVLRRLRAQGRCQNRVLVVGRERSVAEMIRELRRDPAEEAAIVGVCLDGSRATSVQDVPVLGTCHQVASVAARTGADAVVITAWTDLSQAEVRRLAWQLEGRNVALLMAPRLFDTVGPRLNVRPMAGQPLLYVDHPGFTGVRRIVKGAIDRTVAGLALVALSPIMLVLGIAIRLNSPGGALFRQERVGSRGRTFTMYKFRTMYTDAMERLAELQHLNESDGPLFKIRHDPRVTAVGRVLRRLSFDELPQLLNIVRGEMSFVGPRPPLASEVSAYEGDVSRRLMVKPGLTGLWQVSGRSDLSWDQSVRLDVYYVENWSLTLDLTIIARTVHAVLAARGAY